MSFRLQRLYDLEPHSEEYIRVMKEQHELYFKTLLDICAYDDHLGRPMKNKAFDALGFNEAPTYVPDYDI